MVRTGRFAVCLALGFGTAPGVAAAQDGKPKDDHEEKVIAKIAEKAAKMSADERDRWLREVYRATPDKVFQKLDRDESGVLEADEWSAELRAVVKRVDENRDGKIDRDEYRGYFELRLRKVVEAQTKKVEAGKTTKPAPEPELVGVRYGKLPAGLPAWFAELDTDRDGQVGLYEWRAAGRPIAEFREMDLDGDGILSPAEYLRYVKLVRPDEEEQVPARPGSAEKVKK